jgi:hypothetical protein
LTISFSIVCTRTCESRIDDIRSAALRIAAFHLCKMPPVPGRSNRINARTFKMLAGLVHCGATGLIRDRE